MDVSPEPTMIVRTLKDFNQFIASGNKNRESIMAMSGSSRLRLNFSDAASESSMDDSMAHNPKKRPLDILTGLDVTKRFREKDTELAEAKSTITMLEGRLHKMETGYKKKNFENEAEMENLKRKQLRDKELIDDLQHNIKRLHTLNQEVQDEARKVKQKCNTATYEAETRMITMQQEHMEQSNRLQEEVTFLQQRVLDLETDMEEKTIEVENTQCHADEVMEELDNAQQKLRESTSSQHKFEALELQLAQAQAKIKNLETHRDELAELEKKNQVFEATAAKLYVLEKENTKLREENKFMRDTAINTKLLEEKVINAKHQIMALETRCKDLANFQAKADLYKNNLKQYEDTLVEELGLSLKPTLSELKTHLCKLKKQDQDLAHGVDELCASQKSLESNLMAEKMETKNLRAQMEKLQTVVQQNTQIIKRLQRKLLLLTQERDSLKNVLTTYEAELTINFSTVSQERIDKLTSQLESYREELKLMEEELEDSYKCALEGSEPTRKRERSERTLSLEKKVQELEEEVTKLTQANEVLEGRIENLTLKGDYDPSTTKVLHFKNNPLTAAIENRESELETLQTENEALRERVRLLEEGEQHDITQKVGMKIATEGHCSKDVINLQEQISSMEIQNKRLMEAFKKKSKEMREAIYRLTGYRVDGTSENHYKLTNIYAESSEDYLLFELASNGQLQLLETDFSNTLEELMDIYLHRKNSFPSFLSAVTLDLFNRQLLGSPSSGVEEEMEEDEMDEEMDEHMDEQREQRSRMPLGQRKDVPDDEEEELDEEDDEELDEEEEEEEEEDEEEEEEHHHEHEEDDDGDDLICLD